jgi:hypothetical protein
MNLVELQRKLMAAARANPPSDRVPFAFEKRILARLPARWATDEWALWARALWRATAPCLAVMLLLGAWSLFSRAGSPPLADLSQEFENTVLAAVEPAPTTDSLW